MFNVQYKRYECTIQFCTVLPKRHQKMNIYGFYFHIQNVVAKSESEWCLYKKVSRELCCVNTEIVVNLFSLKMKYESCLHIQVFFIAWSIQISANFTKIFQYEASFRMRDLRNQRVTLLLFFKWFIMRFLCIAI